MAMPAGCCCPAGRAGLRRPAGGALPESCQASQSVSLF